MDTPSTAPDPDVGDPTVAAGFPRVPGVRLDAEIGRGGFATVYRAHQLSVNRDVAVKVDERRLVDARDRRRFTREIIAAGTVSAHPQIVTLYDGGTTPDDHPYLVMELYPGGSYSDRLKKSGAIGAQEVAEVGFGIADALVAAHAEGILHRDVKPGNILISRYGSPALADFGLAALPPAGEGYSVTMESLTPSYAAPEAFGGLEPTAAMDIYALGATLYALLLGRPPRSDPSGVSPPIARLLMMLNDPLPAVDVPGADELMPVIWRATAALPGDRYPTAAAFRDALAAVRAGRPEATGGLRPFAQPRPVEPSRDPDPTRRQGEQGSDHDLLPVPFLAQEESAGSGRRGLLAALAGLIVLVVLAGVAFAVGRGSPIAGVAQRAAQASALPTTQVSGDTNAQTDVTASGQSTGPSTGPSTTGQPTSTGPPTTTAPSTTGPSTVPSSDSTSVSSTDVSSSGPSSGGTTPPTTTRPLLSNIPPPVGTCWSALSTFGDRTTASKAASCAEPHFWEAYATGVLSASTPSPYSNDVANDPVVQRTCTKEALKAYLGAKGHGTFDVDVLPPPEVNFLQGNRGFWCLAALTGKGQTTGSIREQN